MSNHELLGLHEPMPMDHQALAAMVMIGRADLDRGAFVPTLDDKHLWGRLSSLWLDGPGRHGVDGGANRGGAYATSAGRN